MKLKFLVIMVLFNSLLSFAEVVDLSRPGEFDERFAVHWFKDHYTFVKIPTVCPAICYDNSTECLGSYYPCTKTESFVTHSEKLYNSLDLKMKVDKLEGIEEPLVDVSLGQQRVYFKAVSDLNGYTLLVKGEQLPGTGVGTLRTNRHYKHAVEFTKYLSVDSLLNVENIEIKNKTLSFVMTTIDNPEHGPAVVVRVWRQRFLRKDKLVYAHPQFEGKITKLDNGKSLFELDLSKYLRENKTYIEINPKFKYSASSIRLEQKRESVLILPKGVDMKKLYKVNY